MVLAVVMGFAHDVARLVLDPPPPGGGGLQNPPPEAPDGLSDVTNQWIAWAKYGALVAGAFGLLYCAVAMSIGRRNRSHLAGEGASGIPWVVAGLSLAAFAVPLAIQVMNASGG